jgi:hypothetical protein
MTVRLMTFGRYELNLNTGELRRNGIPVPLEHQPARALVVLTSRAGELVTRDELRRAIWNGDTFVDFDRGMNYCIRHLRAASAMMRGSRGSSRPCRGRGIDSLLKFRTSPTFPLSSNLAPPSTNHNGRDSGRG